MSVKNSKIFDSASTALNYCPCQSFLGIAKKFLAKYADYIINKKNWTLLQQEDPDSQGLAPATHTA